MGVKLFSGRAKDQVMEPLNLFSLIWPYVVLGAAALWCASKVKQADRQVRRLADTLTMEPR